MYCNCEFLIETRRYSTVMKKMHRLVQSAAMIQGGALSGCLQMQNYYC